MDTTRDDEPEHDVDSDRASPPTDTRASAARSGADLEREVKVATRNGRYALATALCAAIVSSVVAGGSAVYNSRNQLDRTENVAHAQALRDDRQETYAAFVNAAMGATEALGGLKAAVLFADREKVRLATVTFGQKTMRAVEAMSPVYLVGSEEIQPVVDRFGESLITFNTKGLKAFSAEAVTPGGTDQDGERAAAMLLADPEFPTEVDRFTKDTIASLDEFIAQARRDLGSG